MTYSDFLTDSFEELKLKQEKFFNKYDIDSYPNWFYDQASGILTFSKENKELNFRYYEVGTFSKTSNTWKWSWDNEHTHKKVKEKLEEVKLFGAKNGFEKLTEGLFESSKDIGWDFTSVTCEILNGIGAYRPETENLFIFMVIYDIIENEKAKEEKDKFVNCEEHERRRRAFVCQHLTKESKIGFEESFETSEDMEFEFEDDDFQAWCDECENIRLKQDGWNDESMEFADIKLICERCYFEIKKSNEK
ncbi:MAG: hypothetical protein V4572_07170 [Bacteroidota bacterium]